MLWSMAHPHKTIPTLITMLVVMAGVEGNCRIVYRTISVRNNGKVKLAERKRKSAKD